MFVLETIYLESGRGKRNSKCRGAIRRYLEEHQKRRQLTGTLIDAEKRKRGERKGLDTLVVHALNYDN